MLTSNGINCNLFIDKCEAYFFFPLEACFSQVSLRVTKDAREQQSKQDRDHVHGVQSYRGGKNVEHDNLSY